MLWAMKSPMTLAPFGRQLGTDVDDDEGPGDGRVEQGGLQRDPAAHRVAEDDRPVELLVGDERQHVGGHGLHRVVELATPLGVAVAALIERVHVEAVGQVQADEVPRVRRLVATVQQHDGRRVGIAPLGEVEAHATQDGLAGHVAHRRRRGGSRDRPALCSRLANSAEERMSLGARSSANSFRYTPSHPRRSPPSSPARAGTTTGRCAAPADRHGTTVT